jgi:hypothetical protein
MLAYHLAGATQGDNLAELLTLKKHSTQYLFNENNMQLQATPPRSGSFE